MRVAILSAMHPTGSHGEGPIRGLLAVAGRSAAALQLDLALRLGCERIVCFAEGLDEGILPLLHRAEQGGASFHALASARALSGLVRAQDELFLFAEGVVPDPLAAGEMLGERSGVVALPADAGMEAGFERIDRDHAWAGMARLPGAAVERLAEMPIDVEAIPALLRLGLQSGVRLVPLPRAALTDRRWTLLRDEEHARAFETAWLHQRIVPAPFTAPLHAVADRLSTTLAPRVLARKGRAVLPFAGGAIALAGALAAAHWGTGTGAGAGAGAFAAVALGAFLLRMGGTLAALSRDRVAEGVAARARRALPGLAIDSTLVAVAGFLAPVAALAEWLFAAGALVLTLRALQRLAGGAVAATASDRASLAVVLAAGAALGQPLPAIQLLTLLGLAVLAWPRPGPTDNAGLTMSR